MLSKLIVSYQYNLLIDLSLVKLMSSYCTLTSTLYHLYCTQYLILLPRAVDNLREIDEKLTVKIFIVRQRPADKMVGFHFIIKQSI